MMFGLLSAGDYFNIEFVEMFKLWLHWGAKGVKSTSNVLQLIK